MVLLLIVYIINLKFLISLNKRVFYITKSYLGTFFSFRWLALVKFKMAGDLKKQKIICKWIKVPWLFLFAIKLQCRYSTKRRNWQITQYHFIDRVFYRLTYRNQRTGRFIVWGSHENKINGVRIACIVEYCPSAKQTCFG